MTSPRSKEYSDIINECVQILSGLSAAEIYSIVRNDISHSDNEYRVSFWEKIIKEYSLNEHITENINDAILDNYVGKFRSDFIKLTDMIIKIPEITKSLEGIFEQRVELADRARNLEKLYDLFEKPQRRKIQAAIVRSKPDNELYVLPAEPVKMREVKEPLTPSAVISPSAGEEAFANRQDAEARCKTALVLLYGAIEAIPLRRPSSMWATPRPEELKMLEDFVNPTPEAKYEINDARTKSTNPSASIKLEAFQEHARSELIEHPEKLNAGMKEIFKCIAALDISTLLTSDTVSARGDNEHEQVMDIVTGSEALLNFELNLEKIHPAVKTHIKQAEAFFEEIEMEKEELTRDFDKKVSKKRLP